MNVRLLVREWIVTPQSFILMFWNGGFAQLECLLFKFRVKNNMKTSILDQAMQSGPPQNKTLGGAFMSVPPTRCVFEVEPHLDHFSSLPFSHQTGGNTSVQLLLQQFNSSIVFTWLLWNYLCWESATWLWVSLNRCPNKLLGSQTRWWAEPGGEPRNPGWPFGALSSGPFLQVCRALCNTSGLRRKDGSWKGNYFLSQLSVLMTQIGEVCKLEEMPGWIWNWDQGYIFQWFLY